jgi:hypothetical protein
VPDSEATGHADAAAATPAEISRDAAWSHQLFIH